MEEKVARKSENKHTEKECMRPNEKMIKNEQRKENKLKEKQVERKTKSQTKRTRVCGRGVGGREQQYGKGEQERKCEVTSVLHYNITSVTEKELACS